PHRRLPAAPASVVHPFPPGSLSGCRSGLASLDATPGSALRSWVPWAWQPGVFWQGAWHRLRWHRCRLDWLRELPPQPLEVSGSLGLSCPRVVEVVRVYAPRRERSVTAWRTSTRASGASYSPC